MEAIVLNVESLPSPIREKIHTPKVSVQEHDGGIFLMPMKDTETELWGLLSDGKLTTEKFMEQKRGDKELEI
jgi:hypothetical protein